MNYLHLPKIDLHCHLDGSVRPETILELADQQGITLPSRDIEQIRELMIAPETCRDLDEYLQRFQLPLSVMQTESALKRIAFELFEDAAQENVKYLEVRFAPLLHINNGLTLDQIISSVIAGMQQAEQQYDIHGNLILSVLRHMPTTRINEMLDCGATYLNHGVAGFDVAGSEPDGFCEAFIPHAHYAAEKGYHVTIHAGEQGSGQNVLDAVALLGAERVGHGIHIKGHAEAYTRVKEDEVALETCPSSNIQTKAVESLSEHPIEKFYKDGIHVTINTDNRTVSNTTMTDEVRKVVEAFGFSHEDYLAIYRLSVEHAFASEQVKQHLLSFAKSI